MPTHFRYTNISARYVYTKMCNFHRDINPAHICKNPNACARAGRLASWLEGLTEEDEAWIAINLNWVSKRVGEHWLVAENSLRIALSGIRENT